MIKFTNSNRKIAGLTKDGCTHKNNKKHIVTPLNLLRLKKIRKELPSINSGSFYDVVKLVILIFIIQI